MVCSLRSKDIGIIAQEVEKYFHSSGKEKMVLWVLDTNKSFHY